jgi:K+-transporting ATPase KdpF subunit
MFVMTLIGGALSVALLVYLGFALLFPEKLS